MNQPNVIHTAYETWQQSREKIAQLRSLVDADNRLAVACVNDIEQLSLRAHAVLLALLTRPIKETNGAYELIEKATWDLVSEKQPGCSGHDPLAWAVWMNAANTINKPRAPGKI